MAKGRICEKHGEWCPEGECRWCEPVVPIRPVVQQEKGPGLLPPAAQLGAYYPSPDVQVSGLVIGPFSLQTAQRMMTGMVTWYT